MSGTRGLADKRLDDIMREARMVHIPSRSLEVKFVIFSLQLWREDRELRNTELF